MYRVLVTKDFVKNFKKLDKSTQNMINKYIKNNIQNSSDPRLKEKALKYNYQGYWRYRIGDYRLICEIRDEEVIIFLIDIGHRRDIYD